MKFITLVMLSLFLLGCTTYLNPEDVNSSEESRISDNALISECIEWFDGCNDCSVCSDGPIICTKRYCGPED
jgi:hypothetical protein